MNSEYWEERKRQLYDQLEKDEKKVLADLNKEYKRQAHELEKEISYYYTKYGEDRVLEYRKLMLDLDSEDKNMLIKNIDGFVEKYPQYKHLVPVRESIYKLNRMEGIQQAIYMQQVKSGVMEQEVLEKHLANVALTGANEMAETLGFGKNFYTFNSEVIKNILNKRWVNNENFSDIIWGNKNKLTFYLKRDFAQAIARGDNYQKLVKDLKIRYTDVSSKDIKRLVFTEGTFVISEATIQPFEKEFDEYRYTSMQDSKICSKCSRLSGKAFRLKDREAGVNFPPMHPRCRCGYEIVISENYVDDYVGRN